MANRNYKDIVTSTFVLSPSIVEDCIGEPPVFDPGKPLDPQVNQWMVWSAQVRLAGRLEEYAKKNVEREHKK